MQLHSQGAVSSLQTELLSRLEALRGEVLVFDGRWDIIAHDRNLGSATLRRVIFCLRSS